MSQRTRIVCRVQNLTSPKGHTLNGKACSYDPSVIPPAVSGSGLEDRVGVIIDGVPGPPLSLKRDNLYIMTAPAEELAVAVGRQNLRAHEVRATVFDQKRGGERITCQSLPAGDDTKDGSTAWRSHGTFLALEHFFRTQRFPSKKGDVLIHVPDLQVALLLNSYALNKKKKCVTQPALILAGSNPQQKLAQQIQSYLKTTYRKRVIIFKYTPFRIDREDSSSSSSRSTAHDIVAAVLASKFHIYPCPCEHFQDALEVRYLLPGRSRHQFFVDSGPNELRHYVQNVQNWELTTTMREERLTPDYLAEVDPQMFWSAVLHSKTMMTVLQGLPHGAEALRTAWTAVYGAYLQSIATFKTACFSANESVRMLPDSTGRWNLINNEIHYNIAYRNAKLAIMLCLVHWRNHDEYPRMEMMENYRGSELATVVYSFANARTSDDPMDMEIAVQNMTAWSATQTCDYCGKQQTTMFDCQRCQGAGWCGPVCQQKAWPTHKKVCNELQKAKQNNKPASTTAPNQTPRSYNPKKSATIHAGVNTFIEACGFGYLNMLYHSSGMTIIAFTAIQKDSIFKTEALASHRFGTQDAAQIYQNLLHADHSLSFDAAMSNVEPILKLCLACGPVANLEIARTCVDAALAQAQGSLQNLKMNWMGFTPLEWAAKKGHKDIVHWLVSDPRTASLIHIGTPVGWACYTGRVTIARFLVNNGALPDATHAGFWAHRPPLLAAAENGELEAVKFLIEECGIPISTKWKGHGIREHIQMSPNWNDAPGRQATMKYAILKLKQGTRK